jgi:hypothetical protein
MEPLCQQLAELFDPVVPAPSRHMGIPSTLLHICSRTRRCIYNCDLDQLLLARRVAVVSLTSCGHIPHTETPFHRIQNRVSSLAHPRN